MRDGVGRLTWQTEGFAYAERWDQQTQRYIGLQAGQALQIVIDPYSVLVKSDAAAKQLEADRRAQAASQPTGATTTSGQSAGGGIVPTRLLIGCWHST